MTDPTLSSERELAERREDERGKVTAIWVLYIAALFSAGLSLIVGAVLAYIFRGDSPPWMRDHYDKQISIFWWGVFWVVIGGLTTIIGIGFIILGLSWVWVLIRSVQGIARVNEGRAFRKSVAFRK